MWPIRDHLPNIETIHENDENEIEIKHSKGYINISKKDIVGVECNSDIKSTYFFLEKITEFLFPIALILSIGFYHSVLCFWNSYFGLMEIEYFFLFLVDSIHFSPIIRLLLGLIFLVLSLLFLISVFFFSFIIVKILTSFIIYYFKIKRKVWENDILIIHTTSKTYTVRSDRNVQRFFDSKSLILSKTDFTSNDSKRLQNRIYLWTIFIINLIGWVSFSILVPYIESKFADFFQGKEMNFIELLISRFLMLSWLISFLSSFLLAIILAIVVHIWLIPLQLLIVLWLLSFPSIKLFNKRYNVVIPYIPFSKFFFNPFPDLDDILGDIDSKNYNLSDLSLFSSVSFFLNKKFKLITRILFLISQVLMIFILGYLFLDLLYYPLHNIMLPIKTNLLGIDGYNSLVQLDKGIYFGVITFLSNIIIIAILPKNK